MNEQTEYIYDLFISYAETDRAWVEGYLLDGLTRAGVCCYSEAAFALGVPRLLEFERAIQQSQRTLLILSPAYLAESFGQFTDLLAQFYGLETATWPVIPLLLHPVELPPRLAMLTRLDATDPAEWAAVVERLCAELQRAVPGPAPKPPCPYPGMVPFSEADSDRFFGRDSEAQEILERLRLHPFLTVIGPSGSGKSSLVFAGLVPALRASGLFGPGEWLVRTLRPGESPLAALAAALNGDPANPAQAVSNLLAAHPDTRRLLLVVDQFEELFTLARSGVEPFQGALLRLAEIPNCYLILTVRADFYPDLMAASLWREVQAHRVEVPPLDEDGLRQATVRPAEDVGVFVETALVERLVADAGREPGMLPLVQETLVLLWERVERRFLPLSAYEALILPRSAYGAPPRTGLQVAMARRADAALAGLMPEQQAIARRVFLRLVQFGEGRADTRRQQPVLALRVAGDEPGVFDHTLEHLTGSRLLTLSGEEGGDGRRVDIAHESLIGGWPTLQEWLAERREAEQARRRLEDKAREWVRLGRGSGGLLDEVELLEAERWLASPDAVDLGYSEALIALVEVSRAAIEEEQREKETARQRELEQAQALAEEQQRRAEEQARAARRLRWLAVVLAGVFLLAVGAAVYARGQQHQAEQQARLALSRQLAAQALDHLDDQFDLALLLSLEANRITDLVEVRGSLLAGLESSLHLITFLRGHGDYVYSVAFSPDGQTLASGSKDGIIILWDVAADQPITQPLIGHTDGVWSVAFSPDGQTLASGSKDETIILWEVATGRPIGQPLIGHEATVYSVVFSPDGQTLASGSGSKDSTIILWDVATGQPIAQPLTGYEALVRSVAFSPDGRILASGSGDHTIILWDVATGQPVIQPLTGHNGDVNSVAFSPDGQILASGSSDQTIILWEVEEVEAGQLISHTLIGHGADVWSVAFSPDGQMLASASRDHTIALWDVAARQRQQRITGIGAPVRSVAFSPDGQMLASGGYNDAVILWDVETSQRLGQPLIEYGGGVWSVAFSPDGRTVASGGKDNDIILWDVATGQPITLTGHTQDVRSVAFSPDGQTLASGSYDGTIILWDVATGQPITQPLTRHEANVYSVAFSPDGQTLASGSGSKDNTIILWDVATSQPITQSLTGHDAPVCSVAFSPDGQMLASSSKDNTIILWDVATGQPIGQPLIGHEADVWSVAFSPDGRTLASGSVDGTVILWDMAPGQPVSQILTGHVDTVTSVAFSPDRQLLASGSLDNSIILWDVATRQPLDRLWHVATRHLPDQLRAGRSRDVYSVAFSPDGQTLASGSRDGKIILWDLSFESWQARACNIVARNLTQEEWEQYLGTEQYRETCPNLP